ncbi:hypothetical protein HPP92_002394 [Vanilla planifolia]|uniref:Uncharacterized protein n=1 Tax=Vanilla planifolia TaxID=51239 RepID=A0A835SEM2_VANPL|nr:hypothetical protein HPP92_002394 [Vanilla planifolia]
MMEMLIIAPEVVGDLHIQLLHYCISLFLKYCMITWLINMFFSLFRLLSAPEVFGDLHIQLLHYCISLFLKYCMITWLINMFFSLFLLLRYDLPLYFLSIA